MLGRRRRRRLAARASDVHGNPPPLHQNRDYMVLWLGQALSTAGSSASSVARPLLALALSGSPAQAGLVGAAGALPYVILGLPVGALADRWDRKKVMVYCDAGRTVNAISIPVAAVLGHLTLVQLYLTSLIGGVFFVFFNIAQVATLPRVVARSQLPLASAQNEAGDVGARLVGPALGGLLYQVGEGLPFLADASSYAVSVASLLLIRATFRSQGPANAKNLRAEIVEGVSWLWRQSVVRTMAFVTAGYAFTGSGVALIIIVIAQHQRASAPMIGLIFAIWSAGGVLGSLAAPHVRGRFGFGQTIIAVSWVSVVFFLVVPLAPNGWLVGTAAAGMAFTAPIYNVVQMSYRLALVPDHLQGRVNSVFRIIAWGPGPLGWAITGWLIQVAGTTGAVLAFASIRIAVALWVTLNRHLRSAEAVPETA